MVLSPRPVVPRLNRNSGKPMTEGYSPWLGPRTSARRASAQRPRPPYNLTAHRLREIERIIRHRHGVIPDTDDAGIYLNQIARCLARLLTAKKHGRVTFEELLERLAVWCGGFAPEVSVKIQRDVVKAVIKHPGMDKADECARRLRLSYAERTQLRITTVGACDVDKRKRRRLYKMRKRIRDREYARRRRAERGAKSREEYLANSLTRTQPWKSEGISRATWERRRPSARDHHDVTASPTNTASMLGDGVTAGARAETLPRQSSSVCAPTNDDAQIPRRGQRAARKRPRNHADD